MDTLILTHRYISRLISSLCFSKPTSLLAYHLSLLSINCLWRNYKGTNSSKKCVFSSLEPNHKSFWKDKIRRWFELWLYGCSRQWFFVLISNVVKTIFGGLSLTLIQTIEKSRNQISKYKFAHFVYSQTCISSHLCIATTWPLRSLFVCPLDFPHWPKH